MSSPSVDSLPEKQRTTPRSRSKGKLFAIAGGVSLLLVLVLGLGLGLGLKHRKHDQLAGGSADGNAAGDSLSSTTIQSWRRSVEDYNLDLKGWDFNAPPTTRYYNFSLSEITASPDGVNRTVLAINGQSPGPLIRINQGDRLVVNVTNNMSNATSMHWHGMFQNGTNWFDGTAGVTQCPIPSGQSLVYDFVVNNQNGTYWYHSHASTQSIDGLVGPLIIHSPQEAHIQNESYDFDQIILLTDWYHDLSGGLLASYLTGGNENAEPVPDNGLINGANYFNCSSYDSDSGYNCSESGSARPVLSVEQGKRYRLRFINTGAFTTFEVSIDNHTLEVIEADGTATQPLPLHRLDIATAQRYSVILNANQTADTNYWLRAKLNDNCYAASNPVLDTDMKALITYKNNTHFPSESVDWRDAYDVECVDLNNTLLTPLNPMQAPPANTLFDFQFSFSIGADQEDRALINGTSFKPSLNDPTLQQAMRSLKSDNVSLARTDLSSSFTSNQYVINAADNDVVDILVLNFDDGAHPFHFHGHSFWVMGVSTDQYFNWDNSSMYAAMNSPTANMYTQNPMRRDTVTISAYGWALLRFRNDNPGMWVFHCHNLWHVEAGLSWQFLSRPDELKTMTIPESVTGLCKSS